MERRHYLYERITWDPEKCFGKACIRSMRFPVASVLAHLGSGMSIEDMLREWPELEAEDIHQALAYAASAMEERFIAWPEAASR